MALAAAEQTVGTRRGPRTANRSTILMSSSTERCSSSTTASIFIVLKPVAKVYSACLSAQCSRGDQKRIPQSGFPLPFHQFRAPGKRRQSRNETVRFVINSTLGIGGLVRFCPNPFGLTSYEADFGQTLALWGVGSGPFLMIPVLGPSDAEGPCRLRGGLGDGSAFLDSGGVVGELFPLQTGNIINRTSLANRCSTRNSRKLARPVCGSLRGCLYPVYRAHLISENSFPESCLRALIVTLDFVSGGFL